MKILVVGAGGYIGIPLCEELVARGHDVVAADRWFFGRYPKTVHAANCLKMDIRDIKTHNIEGYDVVIDLAGLSNDASADIDPELTKSINRQGAKRLADLAKRSGVKKYIYSSSCSVYGHGDKIGLTEEDECKPLTLYAECKVRVEDHLRSIADSTFKPVILRNATVFGVAPRMRFDLAVNIMTLRAWRDGRILVMGGGLQRRPFTHVRTVINAINWAMLESDADTYNVGNWFNPQNLSIAQLAQKVKAQVPSAKIEFVPDNVDQRDYDVSFRKINLKHMLYERTVDQGIAEIVQALSEGTINGDDPTCYTLQYYKSLMDWEKRLNDVRLDGRIL